MIGEILHTIFPRQFKTSRKPSDILIRLHNKKKQVFGSYVQFDWNNSVVDGYCAMGLLACQADMVHPDWDKHYDVQEYSNSQIMRAYGLDPKVNDGLECPAKIVGEQCPNTIGQKYHNIGNMVVHLNDNHHWNFKQIGLMLKEFGY